MQVISSFPSKSLKREILPIPQIRVLLALKGVVGGLTRTRLSEIIGNKTSVVVGRAIGYSDPEKRLAFENSKDGGFTPSLLTRGLVEEVTLDIDGVNEVVFRLTAEGKAMLPILESIPLPDLRS